MSAEVYIAGQKLDLKEKDVIALTKQINDIASIQKINADYTNRIICERTPNNIAIAEMLNITGNVSTRPYKYATAKVVSDGITIVLNGTALLVETKNQKQYEYIIYAGNYDLYSKILDKYITDLDWSDLVHTFNVANWKSSWLNTQGYVYALAETLDGRLSSFGYGAPANSIRIDLGKQFPWVFVKTVWQRIFNEAGLEYYGDVFSDLKFDSQIMLAARDYTKDLVFEFDNYNGVRDENYEFGCDNCNDNPVTFNLEVDSEPLSSPNYNSATNEYTAPFGGEYQFTFTIDCYARFLWEVIVVIKKNGTINTQIITEPQIRSYPFPTAKTVTATSVVTLQQGDVVTVSLVCDNSNDSHPSYPWGMITNVDYKIQQLNTKLFLFNTTIDFSKLLPKIKQIDFLIAIMQQYGLMYRVDNEGKYQFIKIDELLNKKQGFYDWSDKLDSESSEVYRIGNFSKDNLFTYNYNDKDLLGNNYADGSYGISIDDLPLSGETISSIIEACGDYMIYDNWNTIASVHAYKNTVSDASLPPKYELQEVNKMIVAQKLVHNVEYMTYGNDSEYLGFDFNETQAIAKFSEFHWNKLIEENYGKYIKLVQKPLVKTVKIWLTPIDIYFLDMFKLIYLRQYQSFFYLNKVSNFVAGKLTDCEIIKVN